jgi:hypothetical protein
MLPKRVCGIPCQLPTPTSQVNQYSHLWEKKRQNAWYERRTLWFGGQAFVAVCVSKNVGRLMVNAYGTPQFFPLFLIKWG